MKVRLEAAKLLLYRAAWLKQSGLSAMQEAAILKLFVSEAFVDSSIDALRIHGGHGYLTGNGPERDVRDAFGCAVESGNSGSNYPPKNRVASRNSHANRP